MANEDKEKCCIKCRQCHTSMKITNSFICYTRTFSLISTFCSPPPHPHFSSCNIRLCLETSNQYALASKQFSYSFTIDSIVWCLIFSLLFFSLFQKLFVSPPHTHTYRASHRKQFFRSSHRVAVRYDSITYLLTSIISFLFRFSWHWICDEAYTSQRRHVNQIFFLVSIFGGIHPVCHVYHRAYFHWFLAHIKKLFQYAVTTTETNFSFSFHLPFLQLHFLCSPRALRVFCIFQVYSSHQKLFNPPHNGFRIILKIFS